MYFPDFPWHEMRICEMRKIYRLSFLFLIFFFFACKRLNDNPPDYIKEVVAYREGDGVIIYFILGDEQGNMTTSDGSAVVTIEVDRGPLIPSLQLMRLEIPEIKKRDFRKTTVGVGVWKREVILYDVGRIKYVDFNVFPDLFHHKEGIVMVYFKRRDGQTLSGGTTFHFWDWD